MKKRKDGLYASQIYLGMVDGKRKYKTVYGKTQKEVKAAAAELKLKLGKGIDITNNDTFEQWGNRLLENKSHEDLTATYLVALNSRFEHLRPIFSQKIAKISVADVQDTLNSLARFRDGSPPLSSRTIGSIKELAGKIFDYAIQCRAIEFNPAHYTTIPKSTPSQTREALTGEQQSWIRETPHRAQRAAMIMLFAGLRRGELIALTWADVNLKEKYISVSKAVEFIGGKPSLKKPKTRAGIRKVYIPDILVNFLSEEKKHDDCMYVIHTVQGKMFTSSGWKRMWESYMCELNIKYGYDNSVSKNSPAKVKMNIIPFTAHQLRHTYATMLYKHCSDVMFIKEQLGHADVETTLNIYTHPDNELKQANISKLNNALCKYDASEDSKEMA